MFQIDAMSRVPIYEQIVNQLEALVLSGLVKEGEQIPSVRSLSVSLSINPNTIQKAYLELDKRGVVQSVPGRGCFVRADARKVVSNMKREKLKELKELLKELAMADITKEEILACIEEAFNEK